MRLFWEWGLRCCLFGCGDECVGGKGACCCCRMVEGVGVWDWDWDWEGGGCGESGGGRIGECDDEV